MSKASTDWAAIQSQFEFDVYPKRDAVLVRGRGAKVWDAAGREYLDAAAGYGVANVGHCNEAVVAAIARQTDRLLTCPGTFHCDVRARLLEKLSGIVPIPNARTYLCNSGTEAMEAAIKFARFSTERVGIVATHRGFHGRTLGALSATHDPRHRDDFGPLVPGFTHVPYDDPEALAAAVTNETAAIVLEVVQGEGGVHVASAAFLETAQRVCREHGALLVVDEVQTGFCRTGRMFASMHHDLEPDIMCLAKGIAGGLPLGAAVCGERVRPPAGRHGSTFAGSPLSCAAALAAIGYMEEHDLAERARTRGDMLVARLQEHDLPAVRAIRHLGLMVGLELKVRVQPVLETLLEHGVIALPAGRTVLRLLPPLVITDEEIEILAGEVVVALSGSGAREEHASD